MLSRKTYSMSKHEKVTQPSTTSYLQVNIILKNKRSAYSSSQLTSIKMNIYSRYMNKQNETVQSSNNYP